MKASSKTKTAQPSWVAMLAKEVTTPDRAPAGEGWFTSTEAMQAYKCPYKTIANKLCKLAKQGKLETHIGVFKGHRQKYYRFISDRASKS